MTTSEHGWHPEPMVSLVAESTPEWTIESLQLIAETARRITELRNMKQLAREVVLAVKDAFSYDFISLLVVERSTMELVKLEVQGLSRDQHIGVRRPIVDGAAGGVVGWVAFHGRSALIPDVTNDPRYIKSVPGAAAELAVPLKIRNEVIGVLDVESVNCGEFDEHDQYLLETLGHQIAIAIENSRLYDDLASAREDIQLKATQLEQLLGRELDVQDAERRRIAKDLHDSVTQLVIGCRFQIDAARLALDSDKSRTVSALEQASALLRQAVDEMQFLIDDLRPALLDDLGLPAALLRFAETLTRGSGIELSFETSGTPTPAPSQVETAVYRVIQEALQNAVRHSSAGEIRVRLQYGADHLLAEVSDDGAGFEPEAARDPEGLGLTSMAERAKSIGGDLLISSDPRSGTRMALRAPLPR